MAQAWSLPGEATLRSSPYVQLPGGVVDVMVSDAEATRHNQLDALAARHEDDPDRTIHMLAGALGEVLPKLANRLDVGVVVMGTVGRTA